MSTETPLATETPTVVGPFTDFGQFGEGRIDLRVLDQDEWWVNRKGEPVRLVDMDAAYREAVIAFLRARADGWYFTRLLGIVVRSAGSLPSGAGDWLDSMDEGREAFVWLEGKPLMRRLRALTSA